jgi:hypothetical protein
MHALVVTASKLITLNRVMHLVAMQQYARNGKLPALLYEELAGCPNHMQIWCMPFHDGWPLETSIHSSHLIVYRLP